MLTRIGESACGDHTDPDQRKDERDQREPVIASIELLQGEQRARKRNQIPERCKAPQRVLALTTRVGQQAGRPVLAPEPGLARVPCGNQRCPLGFTPSDDRCGGEANAHAAEDHGEQAEKPAGPPVSRPELAYRLKAGAEAHRGERQRKEHDAAEPQLAGAGGPAPDPLPGDKGDLHDPGARPRPSSIGVSSRPPHSVQLPS
jgi:hypothetical protein